MSEETGLYDPWETPAGTFRRWQSSGTVECKVRGVWQSIPEPAQIEMARLAGLLAEEREACAQAIQLEAMAISPGGEPTAEQWELIHFADRLVDAIRARSK